VNRAQIEGLLVGVALPATKDELIRYARAQPGGATVAARLEQIPDLQYDAIQDVGEALEPVQPEPMPPRTEPPHAESGEPPGGPAYVGEPVEPPNVAAKRKS
jgi:hypothetical protein